MTILAITIYTIAGVILFAKRNPKAKLTITEKMFLPALFISNITLVLLFILLYLVGYCFGFVRVMIKRMF